MLRLLLFGRQVYLKYSMDEMSVYAAQASFFIIMAAFPLLWCFYRSRYSYDP